MRKSKVFRKAKDFLILDVLAAAHIATTTRFGQGSIWGGHHAAKGEIILVVVRAPFWEDIMQPKG